MKSVWLAERPLARAILIAFGIWILLQILERILWVLVLILLAIILAAAMMPIVRWMRSLRLARGVQIPKAVAVLLIYLVGLSALGLILYFVGGILLGELFYLLQSLPALTNQLIGFITQTAQRLNIPATLLPQPQQLTGQLEALTSRLFSAVQVAGLFIQNLATLLFETAFVLALALFLVVESEPIFDFWVTLFPPSYRPAARRVTSDMGVKMGRWLLGQFGNITIIGALAGIGCALLGMPYPALFAIVTAILDLSPMLGPTVIALPAFVVGLTVSPLTGVGALLLFFALAALEAHVVYPLVAGRVVRLSPTLILIAIPVGVALYGGLGAFLAIPVTAALQVLFREIILPWLRAEQGIPAPALGTEAPPEAAQLVSEKGKGTTNR